MPLIHERTFRVRYGECDALGHVNNSHYLRYMQEAAFDGSAAAGYGVERYAAMQRLWLARQTEIEYIRALRYGDSVIVRTWVHDFRKVTSRRNYEMHLVGTNEPVAHAYTEWAFVDSETGRPALIPPEAVSAYFPEGAPPPAPARQRYPAAPPPPPGVFTTRRRVAWNELDAAGYVNNPVYLTYAEDCGINAIAALNWPITRMMAEGCAIVARRNQLEYLQPAVGGDEIEIATWASDVKRVSATRHYTITRVSDGVLLARVNTLGVWMNLKSGLPVRFPAALLKDFAPNLVMP
ncbi:MAG: acyl-CoA thioesterase [Chloroflexi bacterium]|nr:acyl-CoA thioesterase [Chloroflexota bacterium]MCL5274878.1 acyl-CoA thioesterase [Chloroflexota bacterium]